MICLDCKLDYHPPTKYDFFLSGIHFELICGIRFFVIIPSMNRSLISARNNIPQQILAALVAGFVLFIGIILVWTIGYQLIYAGRIFPGVSVAGVDVSGLKPNDAAVKLSQTLSYPITGKVLF